MLLLNAKKILISLIIFPYMMNNTSWLLVFSKRINYHKKQNFHFVSLNSKTNLNTKRNVFYYSINTKKKFSILKSTNEQNSASSNDDNIFKYTKYDKNSDTYIKLLEKKAEEIRNSKNTFGSKIKLKKKTHNKNENKLSNNFQHLDYTTLQLLANELNVLLQDSIVEHITQADNKTVVLHLNKKGREYYLYLCYDNENPIISLGLKIRKLFNRFIEDDYAQKLNPILKYSLISDIYIKNKFIKILCIDFILKRKTEEDIDIIDILPSANNTNRKVTLIFDLHNKSCISYVINKANNEILISPHNSITEKTIDKSYKEGHTYIFPTKDECKLIPNHYEFFSSFISLFKSRKEQSFISSILDLYEGVSYNLLLKFFDYLNIKHNVKFQELDQTLLLDFFNKAYIKWARFINLKEKSGTFTYYPHYDYNLNVYSVVKLINISKQNYNTPSVNNTTNNLENPTCENSKSVLDSNNSDIDVENEKAEKHGNNSHTNNQPVSKKEIHFDTVIELVYYYYSEYFSVNQFYTSLQFCKEFIKKKMPQYEEMLKQYKSEREFCEKQYLLNEQINTLSVFNYTIEKMNDWVDRKTFDALKLIEAELKIHPLEDNRKTHVKKLEEKKEKEETIQKKILNVKPNTIKTSQNIYKGSLLIKINESDISSPFLIIGRNSKQNEKISTQILKFNDLWFHVHQHPGGHVILRNKKINGKIISADLNLSDINIDDDIKYAANIAAYFSKSRKMEKTLVCFTLGKYVYKDSTLNEGAVEVTKYRLVYGRPSKVSSIIKDLNERNKEIEISQKKK
ncbi:FbpA domain protein, putative [Plasmodium vinckei brucechwatti]|uniref:FbpA domain protein, putative n=1 Tax=Plasmodium vinckei brucechwatti TaxID=119398 RepID=A0A6V7SZV4_PLAVN|nr:FbpA domain protein, putative [Plasmodium vinckei brucechwatti]